MSDALLNMHGISKRFPGVIANEKIHFDVRPGEVHALLGENGAGKTTLMNILYGLYQADEGSISIEGKPVRFRSPKDAMKHGIGLVAQHFHLIKRHSVAENIGLGLDLPFFHPISQLTKRIRKLGKRYNLAVDPNAKIWQLSPGEQQRVEILKALIRGANILILDEPTSVLAPQEAAALFKVLETMKKEGKGVIFISHKLDEVLSIAERITVLRKGKNIETLNRDLATAEHLAKLMVGRPIKQTAPPKSKVDLSDPILELDNVWAKDRRGIPALKGISFQLRKKEILGIAGVAGNGQAELIRILTGLMPISKGTIHLANQDISSFGARELFEAGVAHIPEDRNHMGVSSPMSVRENLVLRQYRYPPYSSQSLFNWTSIDKFAKASIDHYKIATPSIMTKARLLSGGNVQKLILARELSGNPSLVVAAHPTYGLDVGATALTHDLLIKQRDKGAGILLVSEDLDELLKLSDRIIVLFEGEIMGSLDSHRANRQTLGLMMIGKPSGASQ